MTKLIKSVATIELAPAKTTGLNPLGVPLDAETQVKKGKLQEFMQTLDTGAIARRYQNIRATAIKTAEAGRAFTKLIVQFEAFGDDWSSIGVNTGVGYALYAGDKLLLELQHGPLFLPYSRFWYENQFEQTIPNEVFAELTSLEFIANPDEMQPA